MAYDQAIIDAAEEHGIKDGRLPKLQELVLAVVEERGKRSGSRKRLDKVIPVVFARKHEPSGNGYGPSIMSKAVRDIVTKLEAEKRELRQHDLTLFEKVSAQE